MNKNKLIINGYIQNPGHEKIRSNVLIEGNKIVDIVCHPELDSGSHELYFFDNLSKKTESLGQARNDLFIIDAQDQLITPGLIDQHIHGGYECDFNKADTGSIIKFLTKLPEHGITTVCPTVMTDTIDNINRQIQNITLAKEQLPDNAAKIAGIQLEGPFINPDYKGAHNPDLFLLPTIENYKKIESPEIKIVTLAPELDKNLELTNYLRQKGVIVSAGHTAAENLYGLHSLTHIFNAMVPIHHRNPGIIVDALINDEVYIELIADQVHVHPDIIKMVLKLKPKDKVIFISDCLSLLSGLTRSGDVAINMQGNFAGSLILFDSIIRKNKEILPLKDLLMYCSYNPSKNLGLNSGYIEKRMDADLVLWDEATLEVKGAFVNGNLCDNIKLYD